MGVSQINNGEKVDVIISNGTIFYPVGKGKNRVEWFLNIS
jgi:uncharacterized protein YgiM (DUF1202 family)